MEWNGEDYKTVTLRAWRSIHKSKSINLKNQLHSFQTAKEESNALLWVLSTSKVPVGVYFALPTFQIQVG